MAGWGQEKERLERQKVEGREVKGPARKAKAAASWVDMGPGCCGGWEAGEGYPPSAIFSEQLADAVACKYRCEVRNAQPPSRSAGLAVS